MTTASENGHSLAFWAAVYAFFANIIALKVIGIVITDGNLRIGAGALLTSFAVAGSVYAKQRRDELKDTSNGRN